jgi:hypothetical protein
MVAKLLLVEHAPQAAQPVAPELLVGMQPLHHIAQRSWVEAVDALAPATLVDHQPGITQHLEVLRDARPAHRELLGELVHRARPRAQQVQQRAPRRVRQR